jgi:hypothetical protein
VRQERWTFSGQMLASPRRGEWPQQLLAMRPALRSGRIRHISIFSLANDFLGQYQSDNFRSVPLTSCDHRGGLRCGLETRPRL